MTPPSYYVITKYDEYRKMKMYFYGPDGKDGKWGYQEQFSNGFETREQARSYVIKMGWINCKIEDGYSKNGRFPMSKYLRDIPA